MEIVLSWNFGTIILSMYLLIIFSVFTNPKIDLQIFEALNLVYQDDYVYASQVFDTLIKASPQNPIPYVLKAGLLDTYMLDHSTNEWEPEFYSTVQKGIDVAKRGLKIASTPEDSGWVYFSLASLYGYRAVRKGRHKSYLKALTDAYRAISYYKKTLEVYPELYDAYLGLGTFHFALSVLPRFVKWFIAPGDYRERSLKEIELAADSSKYTRIPARDEYAWVLAYLKHSRKAVEIAKAVVDSYPNSRSFMWTLSFAYRRRGHWWEVESVFVKLVPMTLKDQRDYYYSLTILYYNLAKAKYFNTHTDDAEWYLDLAYFYLYFVRERMPDLEDVEKGMERLREWINRRKQWRAKHAKNFRKIQKGRH